ncbi:UDP-N-acetylglucosamine 2-epimerase (non-hydrolyzing) [Spiribacter sp. C176]|uniref:UDP-N-acetylglucosamine 2-epimerase (Non-hydrolyzing) n=1 Tax=Spiribacter salilacus TaxID=2664894 RepID=A0A6N7QW13_9GAMM|nr:UDP-N-acetylglucosamine 2-epimerase (non-hydrolyzing) [Spiribacter salilacus]MRH78517.1 UDP-N-acetylglucosamine 2-epimerase (non-hydrolyzing) [Spiribacter salilacus]
MKTIDIIAGARPNFMKVAPIIRAIEARQKSGSALDYRLIHTGQHYDPRLSGAFFEQLGIPEPDVNLEVGSGTQAEQTASIITRYEALLLEQRSDLCLVVGDVTSTMACAIAAQKLGVPVAHVEGGIRSGDWTMPEEINRLVTDAITNYFFTTSEHANAHLRAAGVGDERIFFVGNTMIDTLLANLDRLRLASFYTELGLADGEYLAVTLHRPTNVDDPARLGELVHAICDNAYGVPVIFPVHPRTAHNLDAIGNLPANLHRVDPQPYLEFIHLIRHAKAVITDSGGITEEATVLGVPCMTLRDTTERPETVEQGTNALLGIDPAAIAPALDRLFAGKWHTGSVPPLWDGKAAERIVRHLETLLG